MKQEGRSWRAAGTREVMILGGDKKTVVVEIHQHMRRFLKACEVWIAREATGGANVREQGHVTGEQYL